MAQYQVHFFQIPRWLAVVAGALAIAFAIALFLLSLTVFLLVLPVLVIGGALYYLFGPSRTQRGHRFDPDGRVIETEYREVRAERIDRERR
jgi:hypothetical protein